jgi:hypothetical protein
MAMELSPEIASALAATVCPIVVRLTGVVVTGQLVTGQLVTGQLVTGLVVTGLVATGLVATGRVANVQAPIVAHRIAAVRIELPTAEVLMDVAPAERTRDAICRADPVASVPYRAVRLPSFRHSLARVCV